MTDPISQLAASARHAWMIKADEAQRRGSWRLRAAGFPTRQKFSDAFFNAVEVWESEEAARRAFETHVKRSGMSPALIFLLIGIVWDILWYWWTHRNDSTASGSAPASPWKRTLTVLLAVSGLVGLLVWALDSLGGVRPVRMGL